MRILLGVCGSISAYKSVEVLRNLIKDGHEVRVILTKGAEKFVRPELFQYLGAKMVFRSVDDFRYPHEIQQFGDSTVLHIDLANWAQKFIIAPLSANTLSSLVHAKANDLLTSTFLAYPQEKFLSVFPAMNTKMLNHPFVQENIENLKKLRTLNNIYVDETEAGDLACGEVGEGRLAEVDKISTLGPIATSTHQNKKILITTGATISPLDPVRYLANPSSGITGFYIALEAIKNGYEVTIVKGHQAHALIDYLNSLSQVKVISTSTTEEMGNAVDQEINNSDFFISAAAVADIQFPKCNEKLKKEKLNEGALPFNNARDILKSIVENYPQVKTIGFAAETNLTEEVLANKWNRKPTNLLIGNIVHNGSDGNQKLGFGKESGEYLIKDQEVFTHKKMSKKELASYIISWLSNE